MTDQAVVERLLKEVEADLEATRNRIPELEAQVRGLRLTLRRLNGSEPGDDQPLTVDDWNELSRAEAILRALREAPAPLAPAEIASTLREHGRDDSPRAVSTRLNYLKKRGTVTNPVRGKWVIRADPPSSTSRRKPNDDLMKETGR